MYSYECSNDFFSSPATTTNLVSMIMMVMIIILTSDTTTSRGILNAYSGLIPSRVRQVQAQRDLSAFLSSLVQLIRDLLTRGEIIGDDIAECVVLCCVVMYSVLLYSVTYLSCSCFALTHTPCRLLATSPSLYYPS
jgi:hypothetical protein